MPSQLLTNDKISFVVAKPFTSRGKDYAVGDDFDQDEARDIETFVRARYVVPVVEDIEDKRFVRQWHREIRPKDEVLERLLGDRTQLVWPTPPDSEEVVALETLTHPEQAVEPEGAVDTGVGEDEPPEESTEDLYDPADHTVIEVLAYLAEHPEDRDRVLASEEAGRGRKGILEA